MEKKTEPLGPFKGIYRFIQGLYWGYTGTMVKAKVQLRDKEGLDF